MPSFHSGKLTTSFPFTEFFSEKKPTPFHFFLISFSFAYLFHFEFFSLFQISFTFLPFLSLSKTWSETQDLSPSKGLCDTSKNIWHPSNTSDFQYSFTFFIICL